MRTRPARLLALAAVLVAAAASAAAPGPSDAVGSTLERVGIVVAAGTSRNQKLAELREIARELLDTRAMGHRALGRELAERAPEEREEFLRLFDELIVRAYLQRLLLFRDPEFELAGEGRDGDAILVRTRIVTDADAYSVDYEMRQRHERWLAADILVEGISLTRNYRSQFRRLLERQSFEEILARMRRKLDVLRENP